MKNGHLTTGKCIDIKDNIQKLHVQLDNIQGALECVAEAARQTEQYPAIITRALWLIKEDVANVVEAMSNMDIETG